MYKRQCLERLVEIPIPIGFVDITEDALAKAVDGTFWLNFWISASVRRSYYVFGAAAGVRGDDSIKGPSGRIQVTVKVNDVVQASGREGIAYPPFQPPKFEELT